MKFCYELAQEKKEVGATKCQLLEGNQQLVIGEGWMKNDV